MQPILPPYNQFDVAIAGGGLAGLALSIQLADRGHSVVLFEKERYPFHKVCGEYISIESWDFLESLGLPLSSLSLPKIEMLALSAPNGRRLITRLPLGGFGISRFKIDALLASIAKQKGVLLLEETKVQEVTYKGDFFQVTCQNGGGRHFFKARACCGAFGKRSNLDVKWQRNFIQEKHSSINNFIGVKYHVQVNWPPDTIGLHNFEDGYCGISKIEEEKYCLCYLTTATNLKKHQSSIPAMEQSILFRNPHLKEIFTHCKILPGFPLAISQISFSSKSQVENGVLLLGDAAGTITPLCGNGMSMAFHGSKIATVQVDSFLTGRISRCEMEAAYEKEWQKQFSVRLKTGRILQSFFGDARLSNLFVGMFQALPFLSKTIIRMTHGKPF